MDHQRLPSKRQKNLPIRFRLDVKENRTSETAKLPKVVQKVNKKSTNRLQDVKSIVCTNETKPPKVKKVHN
jgi:hypothetical protein